MPERVILLLNDNLEILGVSQLCAMMKWQIQSSHIINDMTDENCYDDFDDYSILIISIRPRDVEFLRENFIKTYRGGARIIVLLRGDVPDKDVQAFAHKFAAVIDSGVDPSEMVQVFELVADGYHITSFWGMDQKQKTRLSNQGDILAKLSVRELEIGESLTAGFSNKEIARRHDISANTVNAHMAALRRKLRCRNRTEVALCIQNSANFQRI